ncbi:hypothetical protein ACO2Q8_01095 [Larkinella sp. VNQ87]|uniref:hypothetical protein n=1 Tax=Larkinella sp. VNQ87 TaxID=3400921 RepID=UPI003C11D10D
MKPLLLFFLTTLVWQSYAQRPVYQDVPYAQDYSVKHYLNDTTVRVSKVYTDRNGMVQVLSEKGLLQPQGGQFQYPGTLEPVRAYRPMSDIKLLDLGLTQRQFVYLDAQTVFSNAWAGKLLANHGLPNARFFCPAADRSTYLVSDGTTLKLLQDSTVVWTGKMDRDPVKAIRYDAEKNRFWLLGNQSLSQLSLSDKKLKTVLVQPGLTCFDIVQNQVYVGTHEGYFVFDPEQQKAVGAVQKKLPVPDLTTIAYVHGNLWFGSNQGAFRLRPDGRFDYYYGERWLPGNRVMHISEGEGNTVLILTTKGLGQIRFRNMTLHEKALLYEKQVRQRHIRYGFNCDVSTLKNGDLSTFEMGQRDSDNLWTAMYLVSQLYRYKVTGEPEALQNWMESFEAMERLFTITDMPGYFARGFERSGYFKFKPEKWDGGLTNGWTHAKDRRWDWRGTTSSDQTVGQFFALTQIAELTEGDTRMRAIDLIDKLMTNIIRNDWYLIDFDGKPTLWAKWHPDYVNGFPTMVGDRKINSSNILAFLQAAYHFTKKPVYKEKAYELMQKHGYLDNALRSLSQIGPAPANASDWAKMLAKEWNHSDDEMYFLAYWCLYPYAFDVDLKTRFGATIKEHWEFERPEKNSLWNFSYAMTGADSFDLPESIWHLQEFPLDMIEWSVMNSHRKDLAFVPENFRGQTTSEVLPPDERPELKHNRNLFKLDRPGGNGQSELSAGDSFLLPYWMGRYLGVISGPSK